VIAGKKKFSVTFLLEVGEPCNVLSTVEDVNIENLNIRERL